MFTGIITAVSEVQSLEKKNDSLFVTFAISAGWVFDNGASVAVNGVCSTVRTSSSTDFTVEYMPETLVKTTMVDLHVGTPVNLERTLRLGDELGGHMVQGHVDAVGVVQSFVSDGSDTTLTVAVPESIQRYIVHKGSITIDGMSLTVSACAENTFSVSLIEHTLEHTISKDYHEGSRVNIEVDVLAKYVEKLCVPHGT